jgi:hypothetical protein
LVSVTRDKVLREHFADSMAASPLMIVTDTIITPPEDWRYMIWDSWPSAKPHDAVISTVHLDPAYWDIFDAHRVATIKNRTRTAAMSVCGEFLGLHLCLNRRCFLYDNVESVTDLDHMNRLGHEHDSELGGLSGGHFQGSAPDPNIVQQVVLNSPGTAGG